ncbi:SH3 domain-containing protein [Celeribacter sp. PS-C1]|uniref:SH3 domain-containing protein n=1 Tax=Celeribacter sp. PS-C1 TaxID=2820813 RepID=UPI001CA5C008|nr:SH3 domain-containing protein [Celeribacter sp. PS-C1]MBW6419694.1 SH3 domain-containing protein [Celeribacter sp. PS-C1]
MKDFVRGLRKLVGLSALAVGALALSLPAAPLSAQESVNIQFNSGSSSTTINGAVRGYEYIDYVLGARGGQTMVVSLAVTGTNGNGTAYFNILPAGQDTGALYVGSNFSDRRAEVTLPYDGNWAIRVYLMGNDRDADKTVGYSIDVYIAPGGQSSGSSSSGSSSGLLPEEDFFIVSLSNSGGMLNVRNAPRASGALLGKLSHGTPVRNSGGCTISYGQQWCKVQASPNGVEGWVAARFLTLPGPGAPTTPPASGNAGGLVNVAGVASNDVLNVRGGPGTNYNIVGALANGDRVRQLSCEMVGNARWCEIEMQTDMRERGWVNARYLSGGGQAAVQLPSASRVERIQFSAGASGKEFVDELGPNMDVTYLLGARNGQFLSVEVMGQGLTYRIFNPDGSLLLDTLPTSTPYRGQLWQSGDHKIEVRNGTPGLKTFTTIVGIN